MKEIETCIWEEISENPGRVKLVSRRKALDVFHDLEEALREADLYPDEYFLIGSEFDNEKADMPEMSDLICYAQWGNNEGIYLEVVIVTLDKAKNCYVRKSFATGKTLAEDSASYDRMQYIAGYIYKLFFGSHQQSPRYLLIRNEKADRETLMSKIHEEYREYLMTNFVHRNEDYDAIAEEVGLRSLIVHELPKCLIPEGKIEELLSCENALDLLTKLCKPVLEPTAFEINDMISSCDSIAGELERRSSKQDPDS